MEKDKKYSVIVGLLIFFFILFVGVCVAWGLGYINFGKQSNSNEITNGNVTTPNVSNEVTNKGDALKSAYEKYDLKWISKNQDETVYVENKAIKIKEQDKTFDVAFNYGTAKYVCALPGQAFNGISVVTEEGEAYIGTFNDSKYSTTFTKVEVADKIVDVSCFGGKGAVMYSGPYYMTESGKVIDRTGATYEKINKNHIETVGTPGLLVYICDDKTTDIPKENNEYIKIVDENGKNIKAKKLFIESSEGNEKLYLVNEENKLYKFEINNNGIAHEEVHGKNKSVVKMTYDKNNYKIRIDFNDNSNFEISDVVDAYDLENAKYMQ